MASLIRTCRKKFLQAKCLDNESQKDFVIRLRKYYLEWLQKAEYNQTYDGVLEHIVMDRYYESQSQDLKVYLKERGHTLKLDEMTQVAEAYIEAHSMFNNEKNHEKKQPFKKFEKPVNQKAAEPSFSSTVPMNSGNTWKNGPENRSGDARKGPMVCFSCNQPGHKSSECQAKGPGSNNPRTGGPYPGKYSSMECYNCHKKGHKAVECRSKPNNQYHGAAACQQYHYNENFRERQTETVPKYQRHGDSDNNRPEEMYISDMHYPHRGVAIVNGQQVKFMRDTGSSICICRESCVNETDYTGTASYIMLADRSMSRVEDAIIHVDIPGHVGLLKVSVMPKLVSDLIIGNDWQTSMTTSHIR